ncbi:MAG: hypothetical protein IBX70_07710 [Clostridia bacterium]|nr:hypothetical protein [Clostridia bacterium]
MNNIYVSNYMVTRFLKFERNGIPLSITEFIMAFSLNKFYDSGTPIARSGVADIKIRFDKKYDSIYCREYCERLSNYDRYSLVDRVAYFELMRISLPTYSVILNDDTEIDTEAFFSIYNNGYVAISIVYKNIDFKNFNKFVLTPEKWDNVKGMKLDRLLIDFLKIKIKITDEDYVAALIPQQDFLKYFSDTFQIYIEIIIEIINSHNLETCNNIIENKSSFMHLRTFEIKSEQNLTDDEINSLSDILSGKDENSVFNENIETRAINLSLDKNETILLNRDLLIFIKASKYNLDNRRFAQVYSLVEYFFNERCKLYEALGIIKKNDSYSDLNIKQINEYKNRYIDIMKIDINYELLEPYEVNLANLIREKLGIDTLNQELKLYYEKQFNIAQFNTQIMEKNKEEDDKRKKHIEKEEKDKKEEEYKRKERIENEAAKKLNNFLTIITILFAIPTVNEVVDMLYNLDGIKLIYFPIGYAKPISCLIIGAIILTYFNKLNKSSRL